MGIIDEIKRSRAAMLTDEKKEFILKYLKHSLKYRDYAIIDGAEHYKRVGTDKWITRDEPERNFMQCRAPYMCHAAIAEWLHSLGFKTCRYYNKGGIDNGLKVYI